MTRQNESPTTTDAPVPEDDPQGEVREAAHEKTVRPRRAWLRSGRMKWVLVVVPGVVSLGIALKFAYPLLSSHLDFLGRSNKREIAVRPKDYEPIRPFFIPMPSGHDKVAVRVDVRVKWDRLTGARFKRDAFLIRQQIYNYLKELGQWSEDMEANRQILEQGIGRILRQVLGVKDVDVLVEEIQYVRIEALALLTPTESFEIGSQTSTGDGLPVELPLEMAKYFSDSDFGIRYSEFRFIRARGVWSWMGFPMSATSCSASIPPTRWWG